VSGVESLQEEETEDNLLADLQSSGEAETCRPASSRQSLEGQTDW